MMARSTTRSNQRPDTLMQDRICQVDETPCNARPDHTFGSTAEVRHQASRVRVALPVNIVQRRQQQSRMVPRIFKSAGVASESEVMQSLRKSAWCPGRESYATTDTTNRCLFLAWWRERLA